MTIKLSMNEEQTQWVDESGNQFTINKIEQTITVKTLDGFRGCSWNASEALAAAMRTKEAARKSWTLNPSPCAPHNISPEDAEYWAARAITLLDSQVEVKPASRIYFNRHDWTGGLGVIYPTGPNTFKIKDVEGHWLMTTSENGIVTIIDKEDTSRKYRGWFVSNNYYFVEMGCEREHADPRVAFAQLMYNL